MGKTLDGEGNELRFTGDVATVKKKEALVEALRKYGVVGLAANSVGIHRGTVYRWKESDKAFAAACELAVDDAMDEVEHSLLTRGKDKDTIAAIFMLKGHRPLKYRDNVNVTQEPDTQPMSPAELRERRRRELGFDPTQPH